MVMVKLLLMIATAMMMMMKVRTFQILVSRPTDNADAKDVDGDEGFEGGSRNANRQR